MPKPKPGESRDDFVSRCIPIVLNEGTTDNSSQAAAICHSFYDDKEKAWGVFDDAVKGMHRDDPKKPRKKPDSLY